MKNLVLCAIFLQAKKNENLRSKNSKKYQKKFCISSSFLVHRQYNFIKKNFNLTTKKHLVISNTTLKFKNHFKKNDAAGSLKSTFHKKINVSVEKISLLSTKIIDINQKKTIWIKMKKRSSIKNKMNTCKFQKYDKLVDYVDLKRKELAYFNEKKPLSKILSNAINM